MPKIPITSIRKLLSRHNFTKVNGNKPKKESWIGPDNVTIITIPSSGDVDYDKFEHYAVDVMGLTHADIDYFLGQESLA